MSTYRTTARQEALLNLKPGFQEIAEGNRLGQLPFLLACSLCPILYFQEMSGRRVVLVLSDFQDNAITADWDETILHLQGMGVAVFPLYSRAAF